MLMQTEFDYLVIGSGLAGLSFALKVAENGKVCIVTKTSIDETNTRYAQGGIAAVTSFHDDFEKHVQDTLTCGGGLCDESVVRMVVEEAPAQIQQLVDWGAKFDRNDDGTYELAREGGHSEHRVLHHKTTQALKFNALLPKKFSVTPISLY